MKEFFAYIDESGDEGIGKGSRWFVLAAVVVEGGQPSSALGQKLHDIKTRIQLGGRLLHWTKLSHLRKMAVSEEIASATMTICAILIDTSHPSMKGTTLTGAGLYFYAFRWLVERITWLCDDRGGRVRLRPENRGGISQSHLPHIESLPGSQVRSNCVIDVKPRAKPQLPLLQVADAVAGAITSGFEHKYGVTEPSYLQTMKGRLYRQDGEIWGYGLKYMPHDSDGMPDVLRKEYAWLADL